MDEFVRRQKRYRDSGVRGLWFVRLPARLTSARLAATRELPMFGVVHIDDAYLMPQAGCSVERFAHEVMRGKLRCTPLGKRVAWHYRNVQIPDSVADAIGYKGERIFELISPSGAECVAINWTAAVKLREEGWLDAPGGEVTLRNTKTGEAARVAAAHLAFLAKRGWVLDMAGSFGDASDYSWMKLD